MDGDGIPCPECGATVSRVKYTRSRRRYVYRRRQCPHGHHFTTTERLVGTADGATWSACRHRAAAAMADLAESLGLADLFRLRERE